MPRESLLTVRLTECTGHAAFMVACLTTRTFVQFWGIMPLISHELSEDMDPLDRNIEISEEERRAGALSVENRKLGAMLLHGRGYVLLKNALPVELE